MLLILYLIYVSKDLSEIMDMEEDSPAKKCRYESREEGGAPCSSCVSTKTTNSLDRPTNFRTGAVNPETM